MAINWTGCQEDVAAVLRRWDGEPMPLVRGGAADDDMPPLGMDRAAELFPGARAPEAALAGLLLYARRWDDAHAAAQDLQSPEGSYWHAIVHRMEPDAGNSAYWFRRVGRHAIFDPLRARAEEIAAAHPNCGLRLGGEWRPQGFIEICEKAEQQPGSELEQAARAIQQAEWELLFDWCRGAASI